MRFSGKKKGSSGLSMNRKGLGTGLLRKRPLIALVLIILAAAGAFSGLRAAYKASDKLLPVKEVIFLGNTHLTDSELMSLSGIRGDEGFLTLSPKDISARLLQSAWIREVSVRRELSRRVLIKIEETSPFAILEMKGKSFLIDEKGRMLEEMKGAVPFLPVITADPFKNRDIFLEALSLARVLRDKKVATERNRVEIIADRGPESISVVLDKVLIKVGWGDYEQKLTRLFELEDEIRKRGITLDYVDLRFANRVVVKPISEVVR